MTRPRTIGLFGGSFNPPHVAHVLIAGWALSIGEVDEVWVIPTGRHAFGKPLAPFVDRMEMCRRAFGCYGDRVKLLDIEREDRAHYSVDTARELAKQFPEFSWRWILGSDAVAERADWKEFDELARLAPPLVIEREGHHADAPKFALPDISSTLIRDLLAKGERGRRDLEGLIPANVLSYIWKRGLYQKDESG